MDGNGTMGQDDTSFTLIGYTKVFLAIAERTAEETALVEKLTAATSAAASDANDETLFGSLIVILLFVPFSLYCGLVLFVFWVECYQFFSVWNLVSRTRTQNGVNLEITTIGRRNQVSDRAHSQEQRSQQIQEKLFLREFRDFSESILNHRYTNASCAICLSELHGNDKVASIRGCSCCSRTSDDQCSGHHHNPHQFHADCLTQWLEQSPSCPFCRDQILPLPEKEKTFGRGALQLSETLELASLEVEHYLFKALTVFGGIVSSYTYFSDS
jgi:hypothetical protein